MVDGENRNFSQDDSKVHRFHGLYRAAADVPIGRLHLDVDGVILRQDPYSPHPRDGTELSEAFPLDANVNPLDAKQDRNRVEANLGLDAVVGPLDWVTLYSFAHTDGSNIGGFLREPPESRIEETTADGFDQDVDTTDMYFDSYLSGRPRDDLRLLGGVDWLYGHGTQSSRNFEYDVVPDGSNRPRSSELPIDEFTRLTDRRHFVGLYAVADWQSAERWDVTAGVRVNATLEKREGRARENDADEDDEGEHSSDRRDDVRPTAMVGASHAVWVRDRDRVTVFANYRHTYKPAAIDFGPEAEPTRAIPSRKASSATRSSIACPAGPSSDPSPSTSEGRRGQRRATVSAGGNRNPGIRKIRRCRSTRNPALSTCARKRPSVVHQSG